MNAIKLTRMESNLSQGEIATKVGIGQSWLSQIETGSSDCPKWVAQKVAKALGKKVSELFEPNPFRSDRYRALNISVSVDK